MCARIMLQRLVVVLAIFWPTLVLGQVTGRFYLEKETFAPGEPVFLYYEAKNSGVETQNVYKADPYSFCSGYQIHVSSDVGKRSSCAPLGIVGSCLSSDAPVEPGKTMTERILLNYEHKIDSEGFYEIEAERDLAYAPASEEFFGTTKSSAKATAHLTFRIDENATPDNGKLQSLVAQLHSAETEMRRDAARTLASLAPKSVEDVLLSFADSDEFRMWAPLAFHRLNTPRSIAALSELLNTAKPGTYEHLKSADYLAETGDPQWFPQLLEIAKKNPNIANYMSDAAKSGGEQMLPILLTMLQSTDEEYTRPIAISTLADTGSRSAVPILIRLLRSSDEGDAQRAVMGLRQLTHRSIAGDRWFDDPESQYPKWVEWWNREGANAAIYKATECGEISSLR